MGTFNDYRNGNLEEISKVEQSRVQLKRVGNGGGLNKVNTNWDHDIVYSIW